MSKKQLVAIVIIALALLYHSLAFAGSGIDNVLLEADSHFTYNNQPIHPGLVKEFSCWISDPGKPTTISVDVAAEHGNEYFEGEVKVKENRYVYLQKEGENEFFYYKWLGRLNNGFHVLEIGEGGDGSGVFMGVMIVKFEKSYGLTLEGQKYDRLLMSIVRNESLGDGDNGKITVLPDRVILGKSQYRDKPVVLEFAPVPPLFNQDQYSIDKLEEECINKDSTTAGMNNCAMEACKHWDVELNKYYKLLMGVLSKEEKQQLKDAQVTWLKYRDLETKFRMDTFLNNQGTMYSNMAMSEKVDIIKQRVLELKSLYDVLKAVRE